MATRPRVLVVEDEFLIRMMVADHLRDSGFVVIEAASGDDAIAILSSGIAIDLIFTDVRMPGSADGLDVLAFSRRTRPDLPVFVTSGHLAPGSAKAEGAVQLLRKPCKLDDIVNAFNVTLKGFA